ncbi:MAG: ribosome maturation factor RimM [Zymomonas mobilis subsp. pomaceae]|uniref:Ribosome maturation factor RimM n=1 Tax=Zymomonas mobilis subsp. pomaceae (strain ATCC 29192 / DSM 22645 / JCM 10191 / CCUG 17912 / NBRC 13757 / NCIMB 11200 / NRRL B-4491 / Barker I) TaxID=579138 RepID=F8EU34_ZYMMT|nr:ribosome maturation factor RimM [Zymomonas mobilis]AEI37114.1 16S rRNA processing protein RimM [Zymomonas mobilis subsp. pomaceae ATCC 29192]MDX5948485.1 ribosome maturation factor RimM [Zymomonas mobilis subsp. pomaceae]GEB89450.1 ribosome maturation factor RimM [Zymomonas mobilis subsp. pomaceae]
MIAADRPITLAVVTGAHGVTGEVRLKPFTEDTAQFKAYGVFEANGSSLTLKKLRPDTKGWVVRFLEITDRNQAEALRGTALTVPRKALPDLPADEYYHVDLIDLPCLDETGNKIGISVAVENYGAGDILEIEKADQKRFMVPIAQAVTFQDDHLVIAADFIE